MEQILKKAEAYDWISSIKKTLESHLSTVDFDPTKDDPEDTYFIRAIFPIMNDKLQEEIQKAVFWNYWDNGHFFQLDLHYLCNYIINTDNVNMGKSLLECAQYCKSIIQFLAMYRKETPEMVKEKEYREQLSTIDSELLELCEKLTLEHPDQQAEIENAYSGGIGEKATIEMKWNADLLRFFKGNELEMQGFLNGIQNKTDTTVIEKLIQAYNRGKISVFKHTKSDGLSVKDLWQCLYDLGYYKAVYNTFNRHFTPK